MSLPDVLIYFRQTFLLASRVWTQQFLCQKGSHHNLSLKSWENNWVRDLYVLKLSLKSSIDITDNAAFFHENCAIKKRVRSYAIISPPIRHELALIITRKGLSKFLTTRETFFTEDTKTETDTAWRRPCASRDWDFLFFWLPMVASIRFISAHRLIVISPKIIYKIWSAPCVSYHNLNKIASWIVADPSQIRAELINTTFQDVREPSNSQRSRDSLRLSRTKLIGYDANSLRFLLNYYDLSFRIGWDDSISILLK